MEAARSPETVEPPSLITKQPTPEDNILTWITITYYKEPHSK